MAELNTCPFCGGKVKLVTDFAQTKDPVYCFECEECGVLVYMDDLIDKDKSIEAWNNRPSPWHTGTPTEEGFFAVYYYADNEYDYGFADWNGKYWEEHFSFDSVGCRIIAWQKIEPFKEEDDKK